MLSQLMIRTASAWPRVIPSQMSILRLCSTQSALSESLGLRPLPELPQDGPERDLVNFPRPVRLMYRPEVRLGFIPGDWFQFFYKKTGVTGPYMFGVGVITFLCSKEIYIIDHEFYAGLGVFLLMYIVITKFGKQIGDYINKEMEAEDQVLIDYKNNIIENLHESIEHEKKEQWRAEGQKYLFDAKRENVLLQLEAEYRRRQMHVYEEVKNRLDHQLTLADRRRKFEQKHMVNWIVESVVKAITPQQEKDALAKCIADLKNLAAASR